MSKDKVLHNVRFAYEHDKTYLIADGFKREVGGVAKSLYKPTTVGQIGDTVYRKNPAPGLNAGWVYTTKGWLPFGTIINDNSECVSAYTGKPLYDWLHRISPDGNEDFTDYFYWYIDDGADGVFPKKADLQSYIKKLSDVNGYRSDLLCDGITADTNVFVLGNVPSENDAPVKRTNYICWELYPVTGNVAKDDFKAIVEMDIALLTPTKNTNRPNKGYDVFEALFFESADGHWPYLGMLDDRSNGRLRTSGNIDRNGTEADALYRYLGNFPLNAFVTLKFVVNGIDNISVYIDGCLVDTDLNNPHFKNEEPTDDNMCFFEFRFGDYDYFICKEIRVKNLNPTKLTEEVSE